MNYRIPTLLWIAWFVAAYCGVAFTVYRFKNPGLTETQLILRAKEALSWK